MAVTKSTYAVLARVSPGYPPLPGRSPTCYSPVRRSPVAEATFAHDLHVLSTPPAFILSQDQTLQFRSSPPRPLKPRQSFSESIQSPDCSLFFLYLVFKEPAPRRATSDLTRAAGACQPPGRRQSHNPEAAPGIPSPTAASVNQDPARGAPDSQVGPHGTVAEEGL